MVLNKNKVPYNQDINIYKNDVYISKYIWDMIQNIQTVYIVFANA